MGNNVPGRSHNNVDAQNFNETFVPDVTQLVEVRSQTPTGPQWDVKSFREQVRSFYDQANFWNRGSNLSVEEKAIRGLILQSEMDAYFETPQVQHIVRVCRSTDEEECKTFHDLISLMADNCWNTLDATNQSIVLQAFTENEVSDNQKRMYTELMEMDAALQSFFQHRNTAELIKVKHMMRLIKRKLEVVGPPKEIPNVDDIASGPRIRDIFRVFRRSAWYCVKVSEMSLYIYTEDDFNTEFTKLWLQDSGISIQEKAARGLALQQRMQLYFDTDPQMKNILVLCRDTVKTKSLSSDEDYCRLLKLLVSIMFKNCWNTMRVMNESIEQLKYAHQQVGDLDHQRRLLFLEVQRMDHAVREAIRYKSRPPSNAIRILHSLEEKLQTDSRSVVSVESDHLRIGVPIGYVFGAFRRIAWCCVQVSNILMRLNGIDIPLRKETKVTPGNKKRPLYV